MQLGCNATVSTERGCRKPSQRCVVPTQKLHFCLSASKPKYTFDFSEEEDEGDEEENGDDDAMASSPVRSSKDDFTSAAPKSRYSDQEDEDEDEEDSYSALKHKPT